MGKRKERTNKYYKTFHKQWKEPFRKKIFKGIVKIILDEYHVLARCFVFIRLRSCA